MLAAGPVVLLLLASCSGEPEPTATARSGDVDGFADWPLVLYPADAGGDGAALTGRLVLNGSCVAIVDESGQTWLPVWPFPGTVWHADGKLVELQGASVSSGDIAVFGGGEADLDRTNVASYDWVKAPDPECLRGRTWFVYSVDAP